MNCEELFRAIDDQNQADKLARAVSALNELDMSGWLPSQVDRLTECKNMLGRKQFGLSRTSRHFRKSLDFRDREDGESA